MPPRCWPSSACWPCWAPTWHERDGIVPACSTPSSKPAGHGTPPSAGEPEILPHNPSTTGMRLAMARGKHRRGTPVALMAAAFTLLAGGGIVAVTGTADAESKANTSADSATSCRADQVIPLDDLLGGSERGDRSDCADDSARAALNSDKDPRG